MRKNLLYILILTFVLNCLNGLLWGYIKDLTSFSPYYAIQSLSFVGYTYVIYSLVNGYSRIISKSILLVTISNLVDELFFNPTLFEYNEFMAFGLILVFLIEDLLNIKRNTNII